MSLFYSFIKYVKPGINYIDSASCIQILHVSIAVGREASNLLWPRYEGRALKIGLEHLSRLGFKLKN